MATMRNMLRDFIRENLNYLDIDGGESTELVYPELELYARDYLGFAEQELMIQDGRRLINCIAHLKRAMDCQLSIFLYQLGLDKVFNKRNLKFDKKLEFLQQCGIFFGSTLSRLNTTRNKMEHSFEYPQVKDIEAYFDLVVAFVAVLERTAFVMTHNGIDYHINKGETSHTNFRIRYDFDEPSITAEWQMKTDRQSLTATMEDFEDFAYFLRVFLLLNMRENIRGDKYTDSQLLL